MNTETVDVTRKFCSYTLQLDDPLYFLQCNTVKRFYELLSDRDNPPENVFSIYKDGAHDSAFEATSISDNEIHCVPTRSQLDTVDIFFNAHLRALMHTACSDDGTYKHLYGWMQIRDAAEKRSVVEQLMAAVRQHPNTTIDSDDREQLICSFLRHYGNYIKAFNAILVCMLIEKNLLAYDKLRSLDSYDNRPVTFTRMHIDSRGYIYLLHDNDDDYDRSIERGSAFEHLILELDNEDEPDVRNDNVDKHNNTKQSLFCTSGHINQIGKNKIEYATNETVRKQWIDEGVRAIKNAFSYMLYLSSINNILLV